MTINTAPKGFTLIEIIVVIVIISIIGVFGSLFLVNMIKSYQWAEENAHISQKAQVALTRIAVEMAYADKDSINVSGNIITYDATYPVDTSAQNNIIKKNGHNLELNSIPLADRVSAFQVDPPQNGHFTVILTMTGRNNAPQSFTKSIALPR